MTSHAKSKTQEERRKNRPTGNPSQSDSERGVGSTSSGAGDIGSGDDRAAWAEGGRSHLITGGILSQLIQETEDQLAEDKECVDWYQRQIEKHERKLTNLRQLQKIQQQAESLSSQASEGGEAT